MAVCTNHAWIDTSRGCPDCGYPYCDQCLVEFLGQWYCGPCRDRRLAQMQGGVPGAGAPLAGSNVVDLGGWLSSGWEIIQSDLGTFIGAGLIALLISLFSCYLCLPAMLCGMYMLIFRKMTHGTVEFSNLFDGFRRFGNGLLTLIVVFALSFLISGALMVIQFGGQFALSQSPGLAFMVVAGATVLRIAVSVVLSGAIFFAFPHVAARNAGPGEALAVSWEVFRRNPLMFIVTAFVYSFIGLGFCVAIPITFPLICAATAKAYADHFGIQGWEAV